MDLLPDRDIKKVAQDLIVALSLELISQGHKNTGSLISSMSSKIINLGNVKELQIFMNEYGLIVNDGVKANKVPYSRGSKRGGKSRYIQGLIDFVKNKGLASGDKEAQSIAFAIAAVHKKEGIGTNKSKRFSKNGKRKGWIDDTLKDKLDSIANQVHNVAFKSFSIEVDQILK